MRASGTHRDQEAFPMATMTILEAEEIIDIVTAALQDEGGHRGRPVSALKGHDIYDIITALRLRVANEFLQLAERSDFEEQYGAGLEFYDGVPWLIMSSFVPDDQVDNLLARGVFNPIDPSSMTFKDKRLASDETISSFGEYCKSLGCNDPNYWMKVFARIGLEHTASSPCTGSA
jgi:hypothetical protein